MTEEERLKLVVSRFDHYYDSVNNKINVTLVLSTFIVGGLLGSYNALKEVCHFSVLIHINLSLLLILGVGSMFLSAVAATPYLSSQSKSLFYFRPIASMSYDSYQEASKTLQPTEALDDFRNQSHLLAKGLNRKFKLLKKAYICLCIQIIMLAPYVCLLLIYKY